MGAFTASVWHYTVGAGLRNYELFTGRFPTAIDADGVPTLGIMLEKRNSIVIAGVLRYRLIDDTYAFPQDSMVQTWRRFQDELRAYEDGLDPALVAYSIVPSRVASSTHA